MRWFGEPWGAPINDDCPEMPTPVGLACLHCDEPIDALDSGVAYVNGDVAHRECFLRQAVGGVNHQRGLCRCCGGTTDPDPPGMSRRQAAIAAAYHFEGHFEGRNS